MSDHRKDPELKEGIASTKRATLKKTAENEKTDAEIKFEILQKSTAYKIFFVVMDLACGVGAVILIQNQWVATFYIQVIYIIFSIMSATDSAGTLWIRGIRKNLKNYLMWSELVSSAVILPLTILFLTYSNQKDIPVYWIKIWGSFCVMKFVRLIFYLSKFEQVSLTIRVFYQIMPFLWSFLGMLTILFFFFATIGINMFGGRVHNKTPEVYQEKTGMPLGKNYEYINFNDVPSSILALYVNIINNNWIYFTNMFILSDDDSRLNYRWFFVVFQLVTNLFVMTILVGFIIDSILQQFETVVEQRNQVENEQLLSNIGNNINFEMDMNKVGSKLVTGGRISKIGDHIKLASGRLVFM